MTINADRLDDLTLKELRELRTAIEAELDRRLARTTPSLPLTLN